MSKDVAKKNTCLTYDFFTKNSCLEILQIKKTFYPKFVVLIKRV